MTSPYDVLPQASLKISGQSNSYFEHEEAGDIIIHPSTSNQRILLGNTCNAPPMVTINSNYASVGGDLSALNISTNQLLSTGIALVSATDPAVYADNFLRVGPVIERYGDTIAIVAGGSNVIPAPTTFQSDVQISGHLLPVTSLTQDLGTPDRRFRDLYLSSASCYLGAVKMSYDSTSDSFSISDASTGKKKRLVVDEVQVGDGDDVVIISKGQDDNNLKVVKASKNSHGEVVVSSNAPSAIGGGVVSGGDVSFSNVLLSGGLLPSSNSPVSIGAPDARFKSMHLDDLYVASGSTLYLGGTPLQASLDERGTRTGASNTVARSTAFSSNVVINNGGLASTTGLSVMGNIIASGEVTAFSDITTKTNLRPITGALDKVFALTGYTFNRIDDPEGSRRMGLVAQEVREVAPEAVLSDDRGTLSVAYGNLVALLVEAVKELALAPPPARVA